MILVSSAAPPRVSDRPFAHATTCLAPSASFSSLQGIERSNYRLRAIFHGEVLDYSRQQVEASAIQSAKDLGVELEVTLYDTFNPQDMADDIVAVVNGSGGDARPDALLGTIPAPVVVEAVSKAVAAGIPVFGLSSGYQERSAARTLAWVAQDEYISERFAAEKLLEDHAAPRGIAECRWRHQRHRKWVPSRERAVHQPREGELRDRGQAGGYVNFVLEKTASSCRSWWSMGT